LRKTEKAPALFHMRPEHAVVWPNRGVTPPKPRKPATPIGPFVQVARRVPAASIEPP
jgi:hypothetical protein